MRDDVNNAIKRIYSMLDRGVVGDPILSPEDLRKIITDFCRIRETKPERIIYQVYDGVLIMDGIYIERIAPMLSGTPYSEITEYIDDMALDINSEYGL